MTINYNEFRHNKDNFIYINKYALTFNGIGLNDINIYGTLIDTLNFKIQIDGTSSPNTFKWSSDGGSTWIATNIPITTGIQLLSNGISISFSSMTGHTLNDYWTLIGHTSIFPLSWFVTQETSYTLPITPQGIIWQWYKQGQFYNIYDNTNEYKLTIPWTNGDLYISKQSIYDAAYFSYLNPPITLTQAKNTKLAQLYNYYVTKISGNILYSTFIFTSDLDSWTRYTMISDYFTKLGSILPNFYIRDVNNINRSSTLTDLSNVIKAIEQLHYGSRLTYHIHYDAINALLTVTDVQNYNFTIGWPPIPLDASLTFLANYTSAINSINADYAVGIKTGTGTGGAAILSDYLDLAHNDIRFVDYVATFNASSAQIGTIKFTFNANYSGVPATTQNIINISQAQNSDINLISLFHASTSGNLTITIKNSVGGGGGIIASIGTPWNPTAGLDYTFELHYDLTVGNTYIKINNVILGSVITSTGTRNNDINLLRVGSTYLSTPTTSNFKIKLLQITNK